MRLVSMNRNFPCALPLVNRNNCSHRPLRHHRRLRVWTELHGPKPVSVVYGFTQDEQILKDNVGIKVSHQTIARNCREMLDSSKTKKLRHSKTPL
jgi:hypothetical protein